MKKIISTLTTLIAALYINSATAALITYHGDDVDFIIDYDPTLSLFGHATVVGNSLYFQPTAFSAQSQDGTGSALTTETLSIDVVVTTPGYVMESFAMVEDGDYILDGVGADVTASGRLGVVSKTLNCGTLLLPCKDASIFNAGPFSDTGGATSGWSDGTSVDLSSTIGWGSDTNVSISFQNTLTATTGFDGETAFIQKKFDAIGLEVNPIPLPAAIWLFGSGLIGLVAVSRRRNKLAV